MENLCDLHYTVRAWSQRGSDHQGIAGLSSASRARTVVDERFSPPLRVYQTRDSHLEELMKALRNATRNLGVVGELFCFFWGHKRRWIVPMLITLFLLGVLIVLAQSSAIAPFIYTLF
jgi:hypothetical protein